MGIRAEYHVAIKAETAEGVDAVPTVSDLLTLVEPPTIGQNINQSGGDAAPGTHARQRSVVGRVERTISGGAYLVGTREASTVATPALPLVGRLMEAGGMARNTLDDLTYVKLTSHTGVFLRGETVTWSGGSGTAMNFAVPRAAGAWLVLDTDDDPVAGGTVLTGSTSGATATTAAIGDSRDAYVMKPTSRQTVLVTATHGSYSGFAAAAGDILVVCNSTASTETAGFLGASGVIVSVSGSGGTRTFEVDMLYQGASGFTVGARVTYRSASTGALYGGGGSAPTVTVVAPGVGSSYSMYALMPGAKIRSLGMRGTWGLAAAAGEPGRLNFDLRGTFEQHQAGTLFSSPVFVDPQNVPRLELAAVVVNNWPLAGQTFEYSHSAALAPRIDYHGPNGVRATRRTGRDPKLSLDPEMISPLSIDPFALLTAGSNVYVAGQIGWEPSNMFLVLINYGQITQCSLGNRDQEITTPIEVSCRIDPSNADSDVLVYVL